MESDLFSRSDLRNLMSGQLVIISHLPDCQWKSGYICALEAIATAIGTHLGISSRTLPAQLTSNTQLEATYAEILPGP